MTAVGFPEVAQPVSMIAAMMMRQILRMFKWSSLTNPGQIITIIRDYHHHRTQESCHNGKGLRVTAGFAIRSERNRHCRNDRYGRRKPKTT
jgi:hypothetical protein